MNIDGYTKNYKNRFIKGYIKEFIKKNIYKDHIYGIEDLRSKTELNME